MGQAARRHVVKRYSWDHVFDRLLDEVYGNALMAARARVEFPARWFGGRAGNGAHQQRMAVTE